MPDENFEYDNAQVPAPAQPQTGELAIRTDTLPDRSLAAERITDVLPPTAYERIGQMALTEQQEAVLNEPLPDDEADIRPDDGAVYASHDFYRRQLNRAFGRCGWTLVPGSPLTQRPNTNEWYQRWTLFIGGVYVAEAIASRDYQPDNARMDLSDVAEAIKSDALRRCCKDLGIAIECWNKRWTQRWRHEHAIKVVARVWSKGQQSNKNLWRRKDSDPFPNELTSGAGGGQRGGVASPDSPTPRPAPAPVPQAESGDANYQRWANEFGPAAAVSGDAVGAPGNAPTEPAGGKTTGATAGTPPRQQGGEADKPAAVAGPSDNARAASAKAGAAPQQTTMHGSAAPPADPKKPATRGVTPRQVNFVWVRARTAGLARGSDCNRLIDLLTEFGIAGADTPGRTSEETAAAMIARIPGTRLTEFLKRVDSLRGQDPNTAETI